MQERPSLDFLVHMGDAVNDDSVPGSGFTDFIDPARNFLGGGAFDHTCTSRPHIVASRYAHHVVNVDIEGNHVSVTA